MSEIQSSQSEPSSSQKNKKELERLEKEETIAKQKQHHEQLFNKALEEVGDEKENDNEKKKGHSTSFIIDRNRALLIISYLKGMVNGKEDASFKHNIFKQR